MVAAVVHGLAAVGDRIRDRSCGRGSVIAPRNVSDYGAAGAEVAAASRVAGGGAGQPPRRRRDSGPGCVSRGEMARPGERLARDFNPLRRRRV